MRVAMDWRMPTGFLPHALDQDLLLPHRLPEGLLSDHLVNSISHTVDALDLRAFSIRNGSGAARNQPSTPAMMVKVLVDGCATGVCPSPEIASKLHEHRGLRAENRSVAQTPRSTQTLKSLARHAVDKVA